jgi:hypothetical protein
MALPICQAARISASTSTRSATVRQRIERSRDEGVAGLATVMAVALFVIYARTCNSGYKPPMRSR